MKSAAERRDTVAGGVLCTHQTAAERLTVRVASMKNDRRELGL